MKLSHFKNNEHRKQKCFLFRISNFSQSSIFVSLVWILTSLVKKGNQYIWPCQKSLLRHNTFICPPNFFFWISVKEKRFRVRAVFSYTNWCLRTLTLLTHRITGYWGLAKMPSTSHQAFDWNGKRRVFLPAMICWPKPNIT